MSTTTSDIASFDRAARDLDGWACGIGPDETRYAVPSGSVDNGPTLVAPPVSVRAWLAESPRLWALKNIPPEGNRKSRLVCLISAWHDDSAWSAAATLTGLSGQQTPTDVVRHLSASRLVAIKLR